MWDPRSDTSIDPLDGFQGGGWVASGILAGRYSDGWIGLYAVGDHARVPDSEVPPGSPSWLSAGDSRVYVNHPGADGSEIWTYDTSPDGERVEPTIEAASPQWVSAPADRSRIVVTDFVAGGSETTVHDGRTGERLVGPLHGPGVTAVSPDGVLVGATNGDIVEYDLDTLRPVASFPGARGDVGCAPVQRRRHRAPRRLRRPDRVGLRRRHQDPPRRPDPRRRAALRLRVPAPGRAGGGGQRSRRASRSGTSIPTTWPTAACRMAGRNLTATEWSTYLGDIGPRRPTCPDYE